MTSLILVCPACGVSYPVDAGLQDLAARQALAAALGLWPRELQPHLIGYLGLHKPPQRQIAMAKLARLLGDLVTLVREGQVTRHREPRPASLAQWGAGLEEVLKMHDAGTLTLPLSGHGLLAEIVHRQAGQAAAQEVASRQPLHPSHRPAARDPATPRDADTPPPPAGRDADATRAGLTAIGQLTAALRRRRPARDAVTSTTTPTPPNGEPHASV